MDNTDAPRPQHPAPLPLETGPDVLLCVPHVPKLQYLDRLSHRDGTCDCARALAEARRMAGLLHHTQGGAR